MNESTPNVGKRAHNFKNITGNRFGRLVALNYSHTIGKIAYWDFRCDCGKKKVINGLNVRAGYTKSCGCLHGTKKSKLGIPVKRIRAYGTWRAMIRRCCVPEDKDYHRYGGRGITVCPEWLEGFVNFFRDMGERPAGRTLERKNNEEGYSKDNCKWASPNEQARNRRSNTVIKIGNETKCLSEWREYFGISKSCYQWRIRHGWDRVESLTTPSVGSGISDWRWVLELV